MSRSANSTPNVVSIWNASPKNPERRANAIDVLLIGRVPAVYTEEVLKRAGFEIHTLPLWDANNMTWAELPSFPVVIFGNTVSPLQAAGIGKQLRRYHPESRLLLMRGSNLHPIYGPEKMPRNLTIFDSILEGLDGPAALVAETHRLAGVFRRKAAAPAHTHLLPA
jgi:hypothetical protein